MFTVLGSIIGCASIFVLLTAKSVLVGGAGLLISLYLIDRGREKNKTAKNK